MKKYTLFFALMATAVIGFGQIRFGVKGGLVTSSLNKETLPTITDQGGVSKFKLALQDGNYGVNFGFLVRAELGKMFIQPELNFQSNSANFKLDQFGNPNTGKDILKESYQYLNIPVMIGYRLGPLRFQAGPQGHLFLNSTSDLFDFTDYKQNFKKLTIGYALGGGLDIWNLMVDLRYQGNFSRFGDHITFFGKDYEFSQHPNQWTLTVGWLFGKQR